MNKNEKEDYDSNQDEQLDEMDMGGADTDDSFNANDPELPLT